MTNIKPTVIARTSTDGQPPEIIISDGTSSIKVSLTDQTASQLAISALQAVTASKMPLKTPGTAVNVVARSIPVTRIGWVPPEQSDAPDGQTAMALDIAGCQLEFSASPEYWRFILEQFVKIKPAKRSRN